MTSPTARSLNMLRKTGHRCQVVERFNVFSKRRVDLFGFIDIVCLSQGNRLIGVQTTSGDNLSKRCAKVIEECADAAKDWLRCGGWIEIHGWRMVGARGKRKLWECRVVQATLRDGEIEFLEVGGC